MIDNTRIFFKSKNLGILVVCVIWNHYILIIIILYLLTNVPETVMEDVEMLQ